MYLLYLGSMKNKPQSFGTYANAYEAGQVWLADELHDSNFWIEKVE